MLCIDHHSTDPYFNLAVEEFLLHNFTDDIFMLYRNDPSVIVGKHQNAFAEVNYWFVKEKNIKVVRRLSGGGTVFHDAGNLNFSFIRNGQEGNLIDFRRFTQPIVDVLNNLGVPAEHSGRNDLLIDGLKFSGNAEHVYKTRILHHGTLLYSSRLDDLREALKVKPGQYQDKAVKSVRSMVTNISEHLQPAMSMDDFQNTVIQYIVSNTPGAVRYTLSPTDIANIEKKVVDKYATWEWNFGYSPRFTFSQTGTIQQYSFEINLEIEKGIIRQVMVKKDALVVPEYAELLTGTSYREDSVEASLRGYEQAPPGFVNLFF
jgi:lipoate---protein ligase